MAKKKSTRRGRRFAKAGLPKFDAKKHVRLTDLAQKCRISYQSLYLRQRRSDIKAIATNYNGVEVIAFLKKDAEKIIKDGAKPMEKNSVTFKKIEKQLNMARPKLVNILLKLKISPVKRQGDSNRQNLTISQEQFKRVLKEVSA